MASFPTSVKMGGSGRTGPKGGTSSLAVTDTCEGKQSPHSQHSRISSSTKPAQELLFHLA